MLELLAAIHDMDPTAAILWSLLAFAASMYPLGIMLGSECSPCCPCPCPTGTLPDTLTVTFSGLPDQTRGPDNIGLSFSSCFGSGAAGRILEPGGVAGTDDGPISSVSLTNAGSGYARLGRVAPTITASGGGTGATLAVVLETAKDACNIDYWSVSSVTVSAGGTGYTDGEPVTFTEASGDSVDAGASGTINTVRVEPTVSASVFSFAGSGATLTPTLTQGTDFNGKTVWSVDSMTIDDPGAYYEVYDSVSVTPDDGTTSSFFYGSVSSVDGNGGITGIDIYGAGEFYKATDEVESVTVTGGGVYYREDPEEEPYVAAVTVTITQSYPSDGTGGVIAASVDDDPESETFGKLSGLSISNAGDDYLAWEWKNTKCCGWYWDDKPVVVRRVTLDNQDPCDLTFTSCYGSGAAGNVTAPGNTVWSPAGPIESVSLTNGGSGYAQLGRTEPTITLSATPGSGAEFGVKLAESKDTCGLPQWSIAEVTVTKAGSGYTNGAALKFSLTTGLTSFFPISVTVQSAAGTITTSREEPTLTATPPSGGSGASLAVTIAPRGTTPETWRVDSIAVTAGGTGYTNNTSVVINRAANDIQTTAAVATVRTAAGGVIESVQVSNGGVYFKDLGITGVTLTNGGVYYKQDASLPPYVATVTVGFEATCPGSGATITPTIDTNTASGSFGSITALTVSNPGDGYTAGVDVGQFYDFIAQKFSEPSCFYFHEMCGGWRKTGRAGFVAVNYRGPSLPPTITLRTELRDNSSDSEGDTTCDSWFVGSTNLANCSDWSTVSFPRKLLNGDSAPGSATVAAGGTYDPIYKRVPVDLCDSCCQGESEIPEEITVTLEGSAGLSGDYVLAKAINFPFYGGIAWAYSQSSPSQLSLSIAMRPGSCAATSPAACDNCIKKCEAVATIYVPGLSVSDVRNLAGQDPEMSAEEQAAELCKAFCTLDAPICSPSGMTFNFYDPTAETQATTVTLTVE